MPSLKIKASYVDDDSSTIVLVAPVTTNQQLKTDCDAFGFGYVENHEVSGLERYPFVLEEYDEKLALLDWGSFLEKNKATIDILARPLGLGSIITYEEVDESGHKHGPYCYRVTVVEYFD